MSSRQAMIAPATSPSEMNLIRAPVLPDFLDERLVAGSVEDADCDVLHVDLFALATRRMFSFVGSRISTTSAASGPAASFSM